MAAAVERRFGGVDVLINNAGVFRAAPFLELSVEEFDTVLAANLRSVFLVSRKSCLAWSREAEAMFLT